MYDRLRSALWCWYLGFLELDGEKIWRHLTTGSCFGELEELHSPLIFKEICSPSLGILRQSFWIGEWIGGNVRIPRVVISLFHDFLGLVVVYVMVLVW